MPDEQFSTVDEATIAFHEMFLSLQRAGFTEEQAFEMVKEAFNQVVEKGLR